MEEQPPECRIPATLDPGGLLRFEVSEEQAYQIYEQVKTEYESAADDDLVPVRFMMDHDGYAEVIDGVETLATRLPKVGLKHVHLTHDPAYALTVVVDANQIAETASATSDTLDNVDEDDVFSQEFQVSKNAAILVIRQLEAAFDGAEDPVDAIDIDQIRENVA